MASSTTQRAIIDDSPNKDPNERSEELSNVEFDVSTEEGHHVQTCTSTTEGEATFESYIAAEHQPIHIENNSHIIIITTSSNFDCNASEASDIASLSKELANILINNNFGAIVVGDNIQLNFGVLQSNNTIKEMKMKIQGGHLRPIFDGKERDGGQPNNNMKNGSSNRSEFCLVPNSSQV